MYVNNLLALCLILKSSFFLSFLEPFSTPFKGNILDIGEFYYDFYFGMLRLRENDKKANKQIQIQPSQMEGYNSRIGL